VENEEGGRVAKRVEPEEAAVGGALGEDLSLYQLLSLVVLGEGLSLHHVPRVVVDQELLINGVQAGSSSAATMLREVGDEAVGEPVVLEAGAVARAE